MLRGFENGHALGIVLVSDSQMIRRRFSIPGVHHLNV